MGGIEAVKLEMTERTPCHTAHKATRAGIVAAALAASMLSLGLLAPSASASTIASQPREGDSLLGNLCEMEDIGSGDGKESFSCDLNDIAGLLSGLLDPVFGVTCLDRQGNVIICPVDADKAPDNTYAPGGGTRG